MTATFDYAAKRDLSDRLITKFGAVASLRRNVASGPSWAPTLTPTDYATLAVKVEFTFTQMQGGNVLATDERWLVAAGPLNALGLLSVQPNDLVVLTDGVERPVLIAKPVAPAGLVVMYDCHIRF
jgi:hypothetical protein